MKNKTFKRVIDMAKPHTKTILIISLLSILISIGEIIRPYIIEISIDDFLSQGIYQKGAITIGILGAIYIGVVILSNILDFITTTTTNMMGEEIIYTIRNKLFKYTMNTNIPFHDKTPAGKLYVRIINDVEDISILFKDVISTFIKDFVLIISVICIMIYFSIKLSLISFIVIPFVIIVSYIFSKLLNKIYDKSKVIRTNLNTFIAESIYGAKVIKMFNIQYQKQKEYEGYTKDFRDTRSKEGIINSVLQGTMCILENLSIALIVTACINNWFGISIGVGFIYAFTTYISRLFEPITRMVENVETVQEAFVSINKIYDLLDEKQYLEKLEEGLELSNIQGKIEFKDVWFSYDNKNWILKDVSFTINPGESVALVGKTGSGKTTITNLINRFYTIQKGEILLDGVNINNISIRNLRSRIGIILQDPFIFAKSIRDNIALNKSLDDSQIEEAIELSSADEFINALPMRTNEIANERGSTYSEGEKQLLAFARIFAQNPSIFILDEATANIDTHTESLIQKSIDKISKDKTSIFIAHRLSTIVNVDKILVLQNGKIIEEGNHKELLTKEGYYAKLYNAYYESLA